MKSGDFELNFDGQILQAGDGENVHVVYTYPHMEGRLWSFCQAQGIVCYLPLRKDWKSLTRKYADKTYLYPSEVLRPMFPSYAFIKATASQRSQVFRSNAVVRILESTPITQGQLLAEIRIVRQMECIGLTEELDFNAEVKEGSKFLIESGPWQGIYGWLKKKRKRFLWTVEILCVNGLVQATLDPSQYKMTRVE